MNHEILDPPEPRNREAEEDARADAAEDERLYKKEALAEMAERDRSWSRNKVAGPNISTPDLCLAEIVRLAGEIRHGGWQVKRIETVAGHARAMLKKEAK